MQKKPHRTVSETEGMQEKGWEEQVNDVDEFPIECSSGGLCNFTGRPVWASTY